MTKKSHRKKIDEDWQQPKDEKVFGKMNTIVTLVNRCIYYTLSIPEEYFKCPYCDSKNVLVFDSQSWRIFEFSDRMKICLSLCHICSGKGYIDFVANAMESRVSQTRSGEIIPFPLSLLQNPKLKAASMIFYSLYYRDNLYVVDLDYLYDVDVEFSLNDDHDKKTVREFIGYFKKYKVERDIRKKFIDQNFTKLKDQVTKLTKLSHIPPYKIACKGCNGNPFDIVHDIYYDEITIKVCGNCYGRGYQPKRDTIKIRDYFFKVDHPNSPKYDSMNDMLYTIIKTAEMKRDSFTSKISEMEFQDKKKKRRS